MPECSTGVGNTPKVLLMQFFSLSSEGTAYTQPPTVVPSPQPLQTLPKELCLALRPSRHLLPSPGNPLGGSPAPVGALCWTQPWHLAAQVRVTELPASDSTLNFPYSSPNAALGLKC